MAGGESRETFTLFSKRENVISLECLGEALTSRARAKYSGFPPQGQSAPDP